MFFNGFLYSTAMLSSVISYKSFLEINFSLISLNGWFNILFIAIVPLRTSSPLFLKEEAKFSAKIESILIGLSLAATKFE